MLFFCQIEWTHTVLKVITVLTQKYILFIGPKLFNPLSVYSRVTCKYWQKSTRQCQHAIHVMFVYKLSLLNIHTTNSVK